MKARIAKEKETALLYGFTEEKEEAVCGVLEKLNIEIRTVAGESITMTLGALAGLPGFPAVRAADDEKIDFPECEALVPLRQNLERLKGLDLSTIPDSHRRAVDVAISRAKSMAVSRTATPEQVKAANVAMIEALQKAKEAAIAQG